jgi:SnoaL-like domain
MLETTAASVTSALNRARRNMTVRHSTEPVPKPARPEIEADRRVLEDFVEAFEQGEVERLVALLAEDATFAMPPTPAEYRGAAEIAAFLIDRFRWRGAARLCLVPTRANGQPAFGCYLRDPLSPLAWAHGLLVCEVA